MAITSLSVFSSALTYQSFRLAVLTAHQILQEQFWVTRQSRMWVGRSVWVCDPGCVCSRTWLGRVPRRALLPVWLFSLYSYFYIPLILYNIRFAVFSLGCHAHLTVNRLYWIIYIYPIFISFFQCHFKTKVCRSTLSASKSSQFTYCPLAQIVILEVRPSLDPA